MKSEKSLIPKEVIGKRNRNKGNRFELEVIKKLKDIGYTDCISSRSQDKSADANKIDIISNNLPCLIQCKYTSNTPNYFKIASDCNDKSKPFSVIWKKTGEDGHNSPGTIVMIPFDFFLNLLTYVNKETICIESKSKG